MAKKQKDIKTKNREKDNERWMTACEQLIDNRNLIPESLPEPAKNKKNKEYKTDTVKSLINAWQKIASHAFTRLRKSDHYTEKVIVTLKK